MLQRQNTLETLQSNPQQAGNGCSLLLLGPAIAAVVIASEYDKETSSCGGDQEYTLDLKLFLEVAGYLTIAWVGVVICCQCAAQTASVENKLKINQCLQAPACCFLLFNLSWAAVGLYMYENEMSEDCQNESIGIMILSWCIIQYALIGLVLCCFVCIFCCVMSIFAGSAED